MSLAAALLAELATNRPRIFALEIVVDGAMQRLDAGDFANAEVVTPGRRWRFSDPRATVVIELAEQEALGDLEGSIAVEFHGPGELRRVRFPCVACRQLRPTDKLLFTPVWGDEIINPPLAIERFCRMQRRPPPKGLTFVGHEPDEVVYSYPASLACQFLVLGSGAGSLYLARYDDGPASMELRARRLGADAVELAVAHLPFLRPGVSWRSPACALAALPPGWHAAADRYRARMTPRFPPPELPEGFRENYHGMVQVMFRREGEAPHFRCADIPRLMQRVLDHGLGVLHVVGWCNDGFDTGYPDHRPDPAVGTAAELRAALAEARALGGRVTLYTNGRLVDPRSQLGLSLGERVACQREDGSRHQENWGTSVDFQVACLSLAAYRDHFLAEVGRMMEDLGCQGLQIDQIGCTNSFLCFDPEHGHATPAENFLEPIDDLLRRVRDSARRSDPGHFVWVEGGHERYAQFYDVSQGHGETAGSWSLIVGAFKPEVFTYVRPELILTGICTSIDQLCRTFVQGKCFDLFIEQLDDPAYVRLLRDFLALRRAHPDCFARGRFLADADLRHDGRAVLYRREADTGRRQLLLAWVPGAATDAAVGASAFATGPVRPLYPPAAAVVEGDGVLHLSWQGPVAVYELAGS